MSDTENTNGEEMEQPATTGTKLTTKQHSLEYGKCNTDAPIRFKTTSGFKKSTAILRQIGSDSKDHGRITR